jgi:chorismate mutase
VRAIRGATTVEAGGPSAADAARAATQELLRTMLERNARTVEDVVSAVFTITPDLHGARVLRPDLVGAPRQTSH